MALFGKITSLFRKKPEVPPANKQALVVEVPINQNSDEPMADFVEFEDQIIKRIEEAKYGEYDGNEIAVDGSHARIFMYAPNADDMLSVVAPLFLKEPLVTDASFLMSYGVAGDPSARELTLSLAQVRKIYANE